MDKKFKLTASEILELIQDNRGCFATDKITVDGMKVCYMYREEPDNPLDSGWRFFAGIETQDYIDEPSNTMIYSLNTIANYDSDIIPFLNFPYGTALERIDETHDFQIIEED